MVTKWNADVACAIREMVTNNGTVLTRAIDNLDEGAGRFGFARSRMSSHPSIHLSDVPRG
jgi:hypothetical protein